MSRRACNYLMKDSAPINTHNEMKQMKKKILFKNYNGKEKLMLYEILVIVHALFEMPFWKKPSFLYSSNSSLSFNFVR